MANAEQELCKTPLQTTEEIIPGFPDVTSYCSQALRSLLLATKSSNELPNSGDDYDYYSSFDGFRDVMDIESKRIIATLQAVMRYHGLKGSIMRNQDATELEDKFDILVDANDQILERVGTFLDEAAGLRKPETALVIATLTPKHISGSWNKKMSKGVLSNYRLLSAKGIMRPQLKFRDKVDNTVRPFIPIIKEKFHARKPLTESLLLAQQSDIRTIVDLEKDLDFPHPYQYELDNFVNPDHMLEKVKLQQPKRIESTPLTLVEDEKTLNIVMEKLMKQKEIAVDLEHHSYRTFQGLTCLLQLSTRSEDFIFDTLVLRSQLHILNKVFTDPNITKVFHGADKDIEWLQRDLGVYVVNMFDTGQAARVLHLQRFSLAYLLANYCNVDADKQYQLADWRIRPLPTELIKYAREDTHYLLYIYDRLRNELLDRSNLNKNLLTSVHHRSIQLCAKRYIKPVFTPEKYLDLHTRSKKLLNTQQLHALKHIHAWRNKVARLEDESEGYVLPNHMMLQISELLPKERQGILACCNPIPPILRQSLPEVNAIVMEARELAINVAPKPKSSPLRPSKLDHPKYREMNPLYSLHDLSHQDKCIRQPFFGVPDSDLVAEESEIFTKKWSGCIEAVMTAAKSNLSVFSTNEHFVDTLQSAAKLKANNIHESFVSPYGMFLSKNVMLNSCLPVPAPASSTWKLKSNTARPVPVKAHKPVTNKGVRALIAKEEEERGIVSLNQILTEEPQMRKVKKDKKNIKNPQLEEKMLKPEEKIQKPESLDDIPTDRKRKKEKLTADDVSQKGAHDYSLSDFTIFAATSAKKSRKGKKKSRALDYNPPTVDLTSEHKTPSAPRLNPMTGRRSETFGKTKQAPQTSWPKR